MRETGTEMSCLMLRPSTVWAAEMFSRSAQNCRAWVIEVATTTSVSSDCSSASASIASSPARAAISLCRLAVSSSTYQSCWPARGSRLPATCLSTSAIAADEISSKAVSSPASRPRACASNASACSGESRPAIATACPAGRGNSFSTAAVMTPSVPSEPMNRSRRS